MGASQLLRRRRSGGFPTIAQAEEEELPSSCSRGGVGAAQLLLRRGSGSSRTAAQEEEWVLPSSCSGGGVGASQLPLRRRSGSFPTTAQEEEWELPSSCSGGGVGASQPLLRRRNGSFPTTAQEEDWELPSNCSGGGVGASQLLLRRRGGSFPTTAQEEEWELPSSCSGSPDATPTDNTELQGPESCPHSSHRGGRARKYYFRRASAPTRGEAETVNRTSAPGTVPQTPQGGLLKENPAPESLTGKKSVANHEALPKTLRALEASLKEALRNQ